MAPSAAVPLSPVSPRNSSHGIVTTSSPYAHNNSTPASPQFTMSEKRNSASSSVRRKSVASGSTHERQGSYPLNDIHEHNPYPPDHDQYGRRGVMQGAHEQYQKGLPAFHGRVQSVQSADSRDLQTPSPDLFLNRAHEEDPSIQQPLASPTFRHQLTHPSIPLPQPQMAIISSGESNRSSKSSLAFGAEEGRNSPISQASSAEYNQPAKLYPQLQYHHQQFAQSPNDQAEYQQQNGNGNPVGNGVAHHARNSSSPASSDGQGYNSRHLAAPGPNYRRNSRPSSTYSTLSVGARGQSPGSPQLRAVSAHSYDSRRSSYTDLTQPVHMQALPPPVPSLDNSRLREQVGSNASLLSNKQTLEMYRANAKKSQDPTLQYELAVFMISVAQQLNSEASSPSGSTSPKLASTPNRDLESPYVDNQAAFASKTELLKEARQILERLAGRMPQAQYYLADAYASGLFTKGKEDHERAFPLFVAASKHGHAEAGYRAALCYEFGWGCRKDYAKAVQFYRQSASKNHPGAMTRLGMACLRSDLGLQGKYKEGVKWLKRATDVADAQYPNAPYELALMHEAGYGDDVFEDPSYAAQLFTQAAELGHADAYFKMGDAYEHGKLNCPRDAALSVHFYTGAAERGHSMAMMALCAWYLVGAEPVLEKNEDEAYQWALKASEFGLPKAEYAVGYFTETGIGCRRDPLEANVWYVKAADHGDERAIARLKVIQQAAAGNAAPNGKKGKKTKEKGNVLEKKTRDGEDKDCIIM
ncbi:Chitin synthase 4 [Rhizina undulata]